MWFFTYNIQPVLIKIACFNTAFHVTGKILSGPDFPTEFFIKPCTTPRNTCVALKAILVNVQNFYNTLNPQNNSSRCAK